MRKAAILAAFVVYDYSKTNNEFLFIKFSFG
jgi:hypothetical protein